MPAERCLIFPLAETRNRFFVPLCVFCLGMAVFPNRVVLGVWVESTNVAILRRGEKGNERCFTTLSGLVMRGHFASISRFFSVDRIGSWSWKMVCLRPRNRVTVVFGSLLALAATVSWRGRMRCRPRPSHRRTPQARLVGNLGDTRTLQFEGLQLFTAAQLRGKLECDLRYQAAARPSGDLEQFLRALEERLVAGYRHCGCPDAKVRASCDEQSGAVRVQIEEGQQYRKGQVEVAAPQQVDRAAIVRCLTTAPQAHEWRIERDGTDLAKPQERHHRLEVGRSGELRRLIGG